MGKKTIRRPSRLNRQKQDAAEVTGENAVQPRLLSPERANRRHRLRPPPLSPFPRLPVHLSESMKNSRLLFFTGIIAGALLTLAPAFGMLGTVLGMIRTFDELGAPGATDPAALANGISMSLYPAAVGLALFPVGVVVLVISLVCYFRAARSAGPAPAA